MISKIEWATKLYCEQSLPLSVVSTMMALDEREVVKLLRIRGIQLRPNFSLNEKMAHENWPTDDELQSHLSLVLHTAYMCEGWHTEKTHELCFTNTDPLLIDIFIKGMINIYKAERISLVVLGNSKSSCFELQNRYPNAKWICDPMRNKPILRVKVKGKILAVRFIDNATRLIKLKKTIQTTSISNWKA